MNKGRLAALIGAGVLSITLGLVGRFEGMSATAYRDPVGIPTICSGITAGVHMGDTATPDECTAREMEALRTDLAALDQCIQPDLTPRQWAALLDWTYNVGASAACGSTLVRMVNAGQPPAIWCAELRRWVYASGRKLPGLVTRRESEYQLCVGEAG